MPFLRELRALKTFEQRFRIDDHLERRESALGNLARTKEEVGVEGEEEWWKRCLEYTKKWGVWETGLKVFIEDPVRYKVSSVVMSYVLSDDVDHVAAGRSCFLPMLSI